MSNKRQREETSEQLNTHHKRLKDDHGVAHRVDPMRFNRDNNINNNRNNDEGYAFTIPLPSEDDNDNDNDNKMINNTTTNKNDTEFGLLLYELASLNVGSSSSLHNNNNNNN
eukprot:523549_1